MSNVHPEAICLQGNKWLAMFGHIFLVTTGEKGTTHTKQAGARDVAIHPAMYRTALPQKIT